LVRLDIIVFTLIAIGSRYGFSQDILATKDLKKGIYQNFNEFRLNSPSMVLDESLIEIKVEEKFVLRLSLDLYFMKQKRLPFKLIDLRINKLKNVSIQKSFGATVMDPMFILIHIHISLPNISFSS
jgi:hypothetical protein